MKYALPLIKTAQKYDVALDADLLHLADAAAKVSIPAPSYGDLVAETVAAVGTKDFDKVAAKSLDALARQHNTFANDVQKRVRARVEQEFAANVEGIFDAFLPVLDARVNVLNAKAALLPAHVNRDKVRDASLSVIADYREVESAWLDVEAIAAALKPFFTGKGSHGARFAPLLVSVLPQPDSLAEGVEIRQAMDGKWEGMSGAYATTYSTVEILPPAALSALGVTFEVAAPGAEFAHRVALLDHITTPATYRHAGDDGNVFEPNAAPKGLVL